MSKEQSLGQDNGVGGTSSQTEPVVSIPDDSECDPNITPMHGAFNAARYSRQALIRKIQLNTGRPLICYVSASAATIERDDVVFLFDLLHNIPKNHDVDLLIHTSGGDIDAAEKFITIIRNHVGLARLQIIVPDFAKSAGTLMALGADNILMSDTSELGPIDPQITLNDDRGNAITHSVLSYLDAYDTHSSMLRENPDDPVARMMLNKLDPATVKLFQAVCDRARTCAEHQLKRWGAPKGNFTEIANKLLDTKRWLTHGQMIGWEAALEIGLAVKHLPSSSPEWRSYWQLYCLQRLALKDSEKLFESQFVSLPTQSCS